MDGHRGPCRTSRAASTAPPRWLSPSGSSLWAGRRLRRGDGLAARDPVVAGRVVGACMASPRSRRRCSRCRPAPTPPLAATSCGTRRRYPAEGADGLAFTVRCPGQAPPHRHARLPPWDRKRGHGRRPRPSWYPTDNGFASMAAMDDAHRPIVAAAADAALRQTRRQRASTSAAETARCSRRSWAPQPTSCHSAVDVDPAPSSTPATLHPDNSRQLHRGRPLRRPAHYGRTGAGSRWRSHARPSARGGPRQPRHCGAVA